MAVNSSPYWNADRSTYEDELNAFVNRTVFERCRQHGTPLTSQRGGDPACIECYVDSLSRRDDPPSGIGRAWVAELLARSVHYVGDGCMPSRDQIRELNRQYDAEDRKVRS